MHTYKLPTSDKNKETIWACRERSPEERAVYFRGNREREPKGIERKFFSASPLVGSLLTFLPKQESKAPRQGTNLFRVNKVVVIQRHAVIKKQQAKKPI